MGTVTPPKKKKNTPGRVSHNKPDVADFLGGWILLCLEEPCESSSHPFPQNGGFLLSPVG